jgi:hypothetical protein
MTNVGVRAAPALPWLSAFPELNVRSYVRVSDRPGMYFSAWMPDDGSPSWRRGRHSTRTEQKLTLPNYRRGFDGCVGLSGGLRGALAISSSV